MKETQFVHLKDSVESHSLKIIKKLKSPFFTIQLVKKIRILLILNIELINKKKFMVSRKKDLIKMISKMLKNNKIFKIVNIKFKNKNCPKSR